MTSTLLATKLYIPPPRPNHVLRPRLFRRLDEGFDRKLTLLSAPAGFGKTMLLAEWIAGCRLPIVDSNRQSAIHNPQFCWLSLDEGDNDPVRFWSYWIAALRTIVPGLAVEALAELQSPHPPPVEPLLTTMINELVECDQWIVLVLDDYHLVDNPDIHNRLAFLLQHLPVQVHLIISSRADPDLPLAQLRARGQLNELRAAELRFTRQEAAAFFQDVMGLQLSPQNVADLETRTEGWIAGLQLAALSMQGLDSQQISSIIAGLSGSHHYIMDYLVEEVLQRQSDAIQTFLLQTSVLDRLCGPLCDTLLTVERAPGDEGQRTDSSCVLYPWSVSQQILEHLEQANLFIVSLDDQRQWYRYHQLFVELLRSHLDYQYPQLAPLLHRRASDWYEQNGLFNEATRHALASGDIGRVAQLIESKALALLGSGEVATLLNWLHVLSEPVVRTRPGLCVAHAWALAYAGQRESIESYLQDAERLLVDPPHDAGEQAIAGHIAAIRGYAAWLGGEGERAVEWTRRALEWVPEKDHLTRSLTVATLGNALLLIGELDEAERALTEAMDVSRAGRDTHVAMMVSASLADLLLSRAELHRTAAVCRRMLGIGGNTLLETSWLSPAAGNPCAFLAYVLCEWNDLPAAIELARHGLELSRQWGQADSLMVNYLCLAEMLRANGDIDEAFQVLQTARKLATSVSSWFTALLTTQEARLYLSRGNMAVVSRWFEEFVSETEGQIVVQWPFQTFFAARVLIAEGRTNKALQLLGQFLDVVQQQKATGHVIGVLTLQAVALQLQGETESALAVLTRALTLAEPENYVRRFVEGGAPLYDLLVQVAARGVAPAYVARLLEAFGGERGVRQPPLYRPAPVPGATALPLSIIVEPLSRREQEILRLLSGGLSNREIAEVMFISIGTVKNHLKSIYSKLDVNNRTQAVNRARELGLL